MARAAMMASSLQDGRAMATQGTVSEARVYDIITISRGTVRLATPQYSTTEEDSVNIDLRSRKDATLPFVLIGSMK